MKSARPRKWTPESERIFLKFAGKVSDLVLANKLNISDVKWIRKIRAEYNIPKWTNRKYTDEQIDYIKANYKQQSVSEMISVLAVRYPDMTFTVKGIKDRMRRYGMIRTKEEHVAIIRRDVTRDVAKARFAKISEKCSKYRIGEVFWSNYYKEWLIVVGSQPRKYQYYKIYVWEQFNSPVPKSHYIKLKDSNAPITIDNLEIHKRDASYACKELTDGWVISTMMHNKSPEHRIIYQQYPELIEQQRLKIQLIREIKAIENDSKLAQASKADA